MSYHLYITASVRTSGSKSDELGQYFCDQIRSRNPATKFITRNLGTNPPPHPTHAYTKANYTPPEERTEEMQDVLKTSDELIDEMHAAQTLIVAVPMYNFSVPSTFKAYIDNIVRIGRTFFPAEAGGFTGSFGDKKAVFITARGAMYGEGSPIASLDLQIPWLKTVYGFMGLKELSFVNADGLDFGSLEHRTESMENARRRLKTLAETW